MARITFVLVLTGCLVQQQRCWDLLLTQWKQKKVYAEKRQADQIKDWLPTVLTASSESLSENASQPDTEDFPIDLSPDSCEPEQAEPTDPMVEEPGNSDASAPELDQVDAQYLLEVQQR